MQVALQAGHKETQNSQKKARHLFPAEHRTVAFQMRLFVSLMPFCGPQRL